MPKRTELPKIVVCGYCEKTVHEGDEGYRLAVGQMQAYRALYTHYSKCDKAQGQVRVKVRNEVAKKSHNKPIANCPCCEEPMRSDTVVRHVIGKHKTQALESTAPKWREEALRLSAPIVLAQHRGQSILRFCLHCCKSITQNSHVRSDVAPLSASLSAVLARENHKECIAAFESYRGLFDSLGNTCISLPFPILYSTDMEETVGDTEHKGCAECAKKDDRIESLNSRAEFWKKEHDALIERTVGSTEQVSKPTDPIVDSIVASVRKLIGDDDEDDPYSLDDVLEELNIYHERNESAMNKMRIKYENQIAALKKRLEEMETSNAVYETIRFGYNGRKDDDDY